MQRYAVVNMAIITFMVILLVLVAPWLNRIDRQNQWKAGIVPDNNCVVTTDKTCY